MQTVDTGQKNSAEGRQTNGTQSDPGRAPIRIANVSNWEDGMKWLDGLMPPDPPTQFFHFQPTQRSFIEKRIKWPDIAGYRGCLNAARACKEGRIDLLVTHLPSIAARTAGFLKALRPAKKTHHLAFAFNFTTLPKRRVVRMTMGELFKGIERFVVFSTMERALYEEYFGIPAERIEFLHWAIRPPFTEVNDDAESDFLLSVGRTGRDYGVLMRAMTRLPHRKAIVVASPYNLEGLDIPSNVEVKTDIPYNDVLRLMQQSRFNVLPLSHPEAPFGHGALVLAMYARRPVIVTRARSFSDYVVDGESCLTFSNDRELADAIDGLWKDPDRGKALAERAHAFAHEHCHERLVIEWFQKYLQEHFSAGR